MRPRGKMNCVTEIAMAAGRNYITPEDVASALERNTADKVRLDVLEVIAKRTNFGAEDYSLCAFVAWTGDDE